MKIDGYDALDSACKKRWCWSPGNYQHRSACGSGGSRNTGMTTRCCLERAYRGCPDPVPEPGAPAPWDEVTPNPPAKRRPNGRPLERPVRPVATTTRGTR